MAAPHENLICAVFPGVVIAPAQDADPRLPGEVLDVFMVPDARLEEFRAFVDGVLAERMAGPAASLAVVPHTVSWTRAHRPEVFRAASGG